MSVISSLFKTQASQQTTYSGLQLNTSVLGSCLPIIYGVARAGVNLIWYGDFQQIGSGGKGSGKGGITGGGKGGGSNSPTYQVAAALALCEGPISGVGLVWLNKGNPTLSSLGLSLFTGTYPQTPWGYLQSKHQDINEQHTIPSTGPYTITVAFTGAPFADGGVVDVNGNVYSVVGSSPAAGQYTVNTSTGTYTFNAADASVPVTITYAAGNQQPPNQAVGYNGIAYVAGTLQLGQSAQIPQINCEVQGILCNSVGILSDADPSLVVPDLLTNTHYGAAFPSAKIGALSGSASSYQNYCLAQGLLISVAYTTQQTAAQILDDIATATNSAIVWNGGLLNFIPYGDVAITGNGKTYTPSLTPVATFSNDDFVKDSGSIGASTGAALPNEDPIAWSRKRPADRINSVKIEWLDRTNNYNSAVVEVKDQALIDQFALRQQTSSAKLFCVGAAAYASAQLQLQRQSIMNRCSFALDARGCVYEAMDIVAVPDPAGNLVHVRITDIAENDDDTYSIAAEEVLQGSGTAVTNGFQATYNAVPNYDTAPASVNAPTIWEPPVQLVSPPLLPQNTPEIWFAASGGSAGIADPNWGGCVVNVSIDGGTTYAAIGEIIGACLQGSLVGSLAAYGGSNPDTLDQPTVNLAMSGGELNSVSAAEAQQNATLCLIDNELLTYVTATTLFGSATYQLSTLYRGLYGTKAAAHSNGAPFLAFSSQVFKYIFPINMIGQTVYFKFQSFNRFGRALQSLSACTPYSHEVFGSGLFGPVAQLLAASVTVDCGLISGVVSQNDDFGLMSDPYSVPIDLGLMSQ